MTKYLSGRVKVRNYTGLTTDRYKYLGLDQAEPNLGNPIGALPAVPSGTQFQIVSIDSRPGERFWVPIQGGLIPGAVSVFDEGTLVGTLSSITQLNFAGTGIGVSANNLGIAATITVSPPGADNSVLFKDSGDFATSTGLTFDDSTDLLSIGGALDINNGSRFRVTSSGLVGIGTTNPTQELHVVGDIRLSGTIVDQGNSAGVTGQVLVKNATGGLSYINQGSVQAGAGGNVKELQYHNSSGLIDGATGIVYDVSTQFLGIGAANPSKKLDVSGDIRVDGTTNLSNVVISGFTTHNANANFQDNDKLFFGTGLDLSIYHTTSSGGYSAIVDEGTGNLIIGGSVVEIKNAALSQTQATFTQSGAVELYNDNTKRLETTSTGAKVTGNLQFASAGQGIDFSASTHASGKQSELLDDYERGSWTPQFYNARTGGTQLTNPSNTQANYVKVGRIVYLHLGVHGLTKNWAGSNTQIFIRGLPYRSYFQHNGHCIRCGYFGPTGVTYSTFANLRQYDTYMELQKSGGAQGRYEALYWSDIHWEGYGNITCEMVYETDQGV